MIRLVARVACAVALWIAAGIALLPDVASARWEERVERQCTNHQACRPVQKTQPDCRMEQVCRQQPQPTQRCQVQSQCQPVTQMVPVCQMVQNCVQGRCSPVQQCRNVPQTRQVCQPRQVCQQVMANAPRCTQERRCQPRVVTTQECSSQPRCQNVVKRVWVPDPVQPPPAAVSRLPPSVPPPAAVSRLPPSGKPWGNDAHQAYKKLLEERLRNQQAIKHAPDVPKLRPKHDGSKLNVWKRPELAPFDARRLKGERRRERLAALRREIEERQTQLARLRARRERTRIAGPLAQGPQPEQEAEPAGEAEDVGSRVAELQSALEQLIAALTQQEGEQEQREDASDEESDDNPSSEDPEAEPAEAGPGGQWGSLPRSRD